MFDFINEHRAQHIAIFSHVRGDGDCLGAQTGLADILQRAGYDVKLYNQEALPENFSFLAHYHEIVPFTEETVLPDLCIAVDCASLERIGNSPDTLHKLTWINIDHHVSNTSFGALNIVDAEAAATCEILARMAFAADIVLSKDAATSFYTGISTDTGSFLYANASAETFAIASRLVQAGANRTFVRENIFENTSKKQVEIYKYLYDHLEFALDGTMAYCIFSNEQLAALKAVPADLEGVVTMIREIQGVELAILFSESIKGICKISMRSRAEFNCNLACGALGGGGHVRASGATIEAPLAEAVDQTLAVVEAQWKEAAYAK
ncbi:MAG: bifunctional oligoribonuclease/PAP phosphatase NrnA [Peptococcaceae bacterium]|nr:bifunctional oligoribonuclease/PAP phosphatase NrnA [Peptococcaceae bacterium]